MRLITKGGYNWADRYPWIVEAALKNRRKQFVIDGEAVVLGVEWCRRHQRLGLSRRLMKIKVPSPVAKPKHISAASRS